LRQYLVKGTLVAIQETAVATGTIIHTRDLLCVFTYYTTQFGKVLIFYIDR
jgi:hypothetical protein